MRQQSRLRRAAGYAGLGLVFYLVFLVATAPAMWLAEAAGRLSDGAVILTRLDGTLWRGAGQLYAGNTVSGVRHLGTLQWRIDPWWLLLGRAQFHVQIDGADSRAAAAVRVARNGVRVRELSAALPADLAGLVYAPAAFFEPRGVIALSSPDVDLSAEGLRANIEIQWQGAGGRFTGPASIGDYRVELNGTGDTADIRLTTLRGDLEVNGQGRWQVTGDGVLRFTGSAVPRGEAAKLEPLLRGLGRDLGGGRREIRFNGRLPLVRQLGFS